MALRAVLRSVADAGTDTGTPQKGRRNFLRYNLPSPRANAAGRRGGKGQSHCRDSATLIAQCRGKAVRFPPMTAASSPNPSADLLGWIDAQIRRCHRKASQARFFALALKAIQIGLAGSLPILALADPRASRPAINGIIGACIVIIEGFQHSFRFEQFWVSYRRSGNELEAERRLHEIQAGPYENIIGSDALLAVRATELVQQRVERWEKAVQKALANRND